MLHNCSVLFVVDYCNSYSKLCNTAGTGMFSSVGTVYFCHFVKQVLHNLFFNFIVMPFNFYRPIVSFWALIVTLCEWLLQWYVTMIQCAFCVLHSIQVALWKPARRDILLVFKNMPAVLVFFVIMLTWWWER